MKFIKLIKDIWNVNKKNYFISLGVLVLGCFFIQAAMGSPLKYSIPFSFAGSFIFMFLFSFFVSGGNE